MSFAGLPYLELERQAPLEFAVALLVSTVGLIIPWLLPIAILWSASLALASSALLYGCCVYSGLTGRGSIVRAIWDSEGEWWLTDSSGMTLQGRLRPSSHVSSRVLWLHWQRRSRVVHMLLYRGFMDEAVWRRLVARLRLRSPTDAESDPSHSIRIDER